MAKLYREHVLGEKPVEGLVSLNSIVPAKPVEKEGIRASRRRLTHLPWFKPHKGRSQSGTAFVVHGLNSAKPISHHLRSPAASIVNKRFPAFSPLFNRFFMVRSEIISTRCCRVGRKIDLSNLNK